MILVALGANLPSRFGNPEQTLGAAYAALEARGVRISMASRIWVTEPVPKSDQPHYRNAVICVDSSLPACDLLRSLHEIEDEFGRVRSERNAARVLDLDLLAYDDLTMGVGDGSDEMVLPHPRMHERAFVMAPLCDFVPDWVHPVLKKTAQELLDALNDEGLIYPIERDAA